MKRRGRIKDRDDQIVTEFSIQSHAGVNYSLQTNLALNYDQGPRLGRSQSGRRQHDFIIDAFAKLTALPAGKWQPKSISKSNQGLSNLSLEQHDDCDSDINQRAAQHKLQSG